MRFYYFSRRCSSLRLLPWREDENKIKQLYTEQALRERERERAEADDGLLIVCAGDQRVCGVEKGRYVSCSDGCQDSIRRAEFRTTFQGHSSMPQKYTTRLNYRSDILARRWFFVSLRRNTNDDYLNELSVSFIGQQNWILALSRKGASHSTKNSNNGENKRSDIDAMSKSFTSIFFTVQKLRFGFSRFVPVFSKLKLKLLQILVTIKIKL